MKEEPAPNKKDDDVPDPLTVSDEEQQEDEPVDTVLLHAATLSMAIDHLPANVGQWRRITEQHYRRATLKFHPDKGGSEELFDQLEKAKAYLFEWAAKWVVLDKAFPKLNKLCYCAKCTDMWDRMSGCKWCLGVTTKHGRTGRCKADSGFGATTGYFRRNRGADYSEYLLFISHGSTEQAAKHAIQTKEEVQLQVAKRDQELCKEERRVKRKLFCDGCQNGPGTLL